MIALIIVVAVFPGLFTQVAPDNGCELANSNGAPAEGHPLGFTFQGCDVYSRIIHGTQASLMVGVFSVICVLIIGVTFGALAGFYGGWVDAVFARLGDIFFALPIVLGALVLTQLPMMRENRGVWTVVLVLVVLGWPQMARITRGAVIEVRNADFVTAARSLGSPGSGPWSATCSRTHWPRSSCSPPWNWASSSSPNPRCRSSESVCPAASCPGATTSPPRRRPSAPTRPFCSTRQRPVHHRPELHHAGRCPAAMPSIRRAASDEGGNHDNFRRHDPRGRNPPTGPCWKSATSRSPSRPATARSRPSATPT